MEPKRETSPALLDVQRELVQREPIFHREQFGRTRADFEAMMADDFWEVGASGRRYGREYVLDVLEQRHEEPLDEDWQTDDFYCQQIAAENYLLTYTLRQGSRTTRRATIWRRARQGWLIVFHQGTVVEAT